MALMGETPKKSGQMDVKQLAQYVYQLEDQIRYCLSHLGSENITPGGITGESLAAGSIEISNLSKGVQQTFRIDDGQLLSILEDMEGTVSLLRQSIAGLESRVVDAETVVDGYDDRLSSAETTLLQKADSVTVTALRREFDDLSVGGRNLLPGGETELTASRFLYAEVGAALSPYVGKKICVSFDCRAEIAREIRCYPYQDSGISIKDTYQFTPSTAWARFSFATEAKDFGQIVGENTGRIGWYDDTGAQEIAVRRIKIELGTMPTDWSPAPEDPVERVENTSVTIDPSGVKMKGGRMDFEAGSEFKVKSGGVFDVFATDEESVIRFGGTEQNPNFSLGAGGNVKAKKITAEQLEVTGGGSVPTLLNGSLANQIIVSDTQPSGHGIMWIKPGAGGGTVDFILSASSGEDMSGGSPSRAISGFARQGSALSGGTCAYGVRFRIYNYSGACWLYRMTVQLQRGDGTGNTVTIFDRNYQALDENIRVGVGDYFEVDTLNSPAEGLENLTDAGGLKMIVTILKSDSTGARFEVNQPFTIRATGAASGGAQTCDVQYIP